MSNARSVEASPEWPRHFPPGCPPTDAHDLAGLVLYLVGSSPPTSEDFESAAERGAFPDAPDCHRAALSCGLTLDYITKLRDDVPRLRSKMIAQANLQPEHGKLKQTGKPGHHSMWLRAAALSSAPALFEVIS